MLVLLSFLISRLIIRSGLRISHSKVFSSVVSNNIILSLKSQSFTQSDCYDIRNRKFLSYSWWDSRYSDMVEDLEKIMMDPIRSRFCSSKVLCQTLAGNNVPLLTITNQEHIFNSVLKIEIVKIKKLFIYRFPSLFFIRK